MGGDVISDGWEEVLHMSQTEKILASPAQYKDIITGEAIPNDRCLFICKELDNAQRLFQECSNIYRQVMRETPGSRDARRMAARQASAAHAGGGYTQKWNKLCDEQIVISMPNVYHIEASHSTISLLHLVKKVTIKRMLG